MLVGASEYIPLDFIEEVFVFALIWRSSSVHTGWVVRGGKRENVLIEAIQSLLLDLQGPMASIV